MKKGEKTMTFHKLNKLYCGIITLCLVRADETKAYISFVNGKTKTFRTPEKAERYILKRFWGMII